MVIKGIALIVAHIQAAIVANHQMLAVFRINPDRVMIAVRHPCEILERLAAIGGTAEVQPAGEHIDGVDGDGRGGGAGGDTRFPGAGALKVVYLIVLASHVLLSMAVVPLALGAFWFAWRKRFETHKKITRALLPIWLYVSVTGVVVYWMLYRLR